MRKQNISEEKEILAVVRLWKGKAEQRSAVKSGKSELVQEITEGFVWRASGKRGGNGRKGRLEVRLTQESNHLGIKIVTMRKQV